jgi:hypothetical protein
LFVPANPLTFTWHSLYHLGAENFNGKGSLVKVGEREKSEMHGAGIFLLLKI